MANIQIHVYGVEISPLSHEPSVEDLQLLWDLEQVPFLRCRNGGRWCWCTALPGTPGTRRTRARVPRSRASSVPPTFGRRTFGTHVSSSLPGKTSFLPQSPGSPIQCFCPNTSMYLDIMRMVEISRLKYWFVKRISASQLDESPGKRMTLLCFSHLEVGRVTWSRKLNVSRPRSGR